MRVILVLGLISSLFAIAAGAPTLVANGVWVENGVPVSCPGEIADGYCWYATESTGSWQDMRASCQEAPGSDLATIESDFQVEITKRAGAGGINNNRWIGLNMIGYSFPGNNGVSVIKPLWDAAAKWADGSTSSFTNWVSTEPNNSNFKPEACAHIWRSDNSWNDEKCDAQYRGLCRFKTNLKCGRRRFISWGDPHYTTWDGLKFDYQGKGLHTTCKNTNWEVTSCHTPWRGNPNAMVQRAVHIQLTQNELILAPLNNGAQWVWFKDNQAINIAVDSAIFLDGGEELRRNSNTQYRLTTKDGYFFLLQTRGDQYIDLRFFAYGILDGSDVEGICGSPDCDPTNEFKDRSGVIHPVGNADSFQIAASSWHTTTNPFTGISNDFVCPTAASPQPSPTPPLAPELPDCSANNLSEEDQLICTCCEGKTNSASGPEFEGCLFDLSISQDPAADCALVPDETCSDDCLGICEEGACVCPNGAIPPSCAIECCTDKEIFEGTCKAPQLDCSTTNNFKSCKASAPGARKVFLKFD